MVISQLRELHLSNKMAISAEIKTTKISLQCIQLSKAGPGKNYAFFQSLMDMYMYRKFGEFSHSRLEDHSITEKKHKVLTAVY